MVIFARVAGASSGWVTGGGSEGSAGVTLGSKEDAPVEQGEEGSDERGENGREDKGEEEKNGG